MIDVVTNPETATDHLRDARTGPQIALEAAASGAPQKQHLELFALALAQLRWTTRHRACRQGRRTLRSMGSVPAAHAAPIDPHQTCYLNLPPWEEARWLAREMATEAAAQGSVDEL